MEKKWEPRTSAPWSSLLAKLSTLLHWWLNAFWCSSAEMFEHVLRYNHKQRLVGLALDGNFACSDSSAFILAHADFYVPCHTLVYPSNYICFQRFSLLKLVIFKL